MVTVSCKVRVGNMLRTYQPKLPILSFEVTLSKTCCRHVESVWVSTGTVHAKDSLLQRQKPPLPPLKCNWRSKLDQAPWNTTLDHISKNWIFCAILTTCWIVHVESSPSVGTKNNTFFFANFPGKRTPKLLQKCSKLKFQFSTRSRVSPRRARNFQIDCI